MLTIKQQLFLLELLFHGKITRKEIHAHGMFSNDADFFKQIKELKMFGYIINEKCDKNKVVYKLTENGWFFANIIAKQNNTPEKYRKIAKVMTWLKI